MVGTPARVNAPSAHCGHAMMLCPAAMFFYYTLQLNYKPEQLSNCTPLLPPHLRRMDGKKPSKSEQTVSSIESSCFNFRKLRCGAAHPPENCQSSAPPPIFLPRKTSKYGSDFCPNKTSQITRRNGGQFLSEWPEKEEERQFLPISEAFFCSEVQIWTPSGIQSRKMTIEQTKSDTRQRRNDK